MHPNPNPNPNSPSRGRGGRCYRCSFRFRFRRATAGARRDGCGVLLSRRARNVKKCSSPSKLRVHRRDVYIMSTVFPHRNPLTLYWSYVRYVVVMSLCWSPNWNEPRIAMGTPQFGILTNPYPNRFGDPRTNMGIAFFWFFFQSRTRSATSHQKLSYPNAMAHLSSPKI